MQLMDDALFNLWRDGLATQEDVLAKSHRPDDLSQRIVRAKRQMAMMEGGADEDVIDAESL